MEVIIHSNVTGLLGTTVISTDPQQTVGQLIREFCNDKGIHHRLDLVLTNCRQEVLHRRQKLSHYSVRNGEELYLSLKGNTASHCLWMHQAIIIVHMYLVCMCACIYAHV